MRQKIQEHIAESIKLKQAILDDDQLLDLLGRVAQGCIQAYQQGHKLLLAGNGGSAADAQHIAGELVNRFRFDRPGLPAIALSTDTSVLTAISNDSSFEQVFARQIEALGRPGDVFIAISTSGDARNIVQALRACQQRHIQRVGLTGQTGGQMRKLCDYCIRVPSRATPLIQEAHIMLAHLLCELIESALFSRR